MDVLSPLYGIQASASDYRAGLAERYARIKEIWEAAAPVAIPFSATMTLDFSLGINFQIAPLTANAALANPINQKPGQSGYIIIQQDAIGARALGFGAHFKWQGGTPGILSSGTSAVDILYYTVNAANFIHASLAKGLA